MRGHDFGKALGHAMRMVGTYEARARVCPEYNGQLKSARLALAALVLCREHGMEPVVLARAQQAEEDAAAAEWAKADPGE